MDGTEPKFLPQWLKGTSAASRNSASSSHRGSFASRTNRVAGIVGGSFLPQNKYIQSQIAYLNTDDFLKKSTGRLSANKSWKEGRSNAGYQHGLCKQDEFSIPHDYGSFYRSSLVKAQDAGGKDKELKKESDWEVFYQDRALDAQMNFNSSDYKTHDLSQRLSTSPFIGRNQSNSLLRRSRSFASESGLEDGFEKLCSDNGNSGANHIASGVLLDKMQKASFDNDFPLLEAAIKNVAAASSPTDSILCTPPRLICPGKGVSGKQDKLVGSPCSYSQGSGSSNIKPDWKSALVEPPSFASSGAQTQVNHCSSIQNAAPNMQRPSIQKSGWERSQLQVEPYKLEEIALKQSLQLIPATPSVPKGLHGLGFSDRAKGKLSLHINTTNANQAANPCRSSVLKYPTAALGGGKLLVLKTAKELPVAADKRLNPDGLKTLSGFKPANTDVSDRHVNTASSNKECMQQASVRGMTPASPSVLEAVRSKESFLSCVEQKRSTRQSIKDRNDFFNSLRQKGPSENTSPNSSLSLCESPSTKGDECDDNLTTQLKKKEVLDDSVITETVNSEDNKLGSNNIIVETNASAVGGRCGSKPFCVKVSSEEEEAAFLRRLGWDEGDGGDEALTEEEINSFILQNMNAMLSRNMLRGKSAWKLSALKMHVGNVGSVSSN